MSDNKKTVISVLIIALFLTSFALFCNYQNKMAIGEKNEVSTENITLKDDSQKADTSNTSHESGKAEDVTEVVSGGGNYSGNRQLNKVIIKITSNIGDTTKEIVSSVSDVAVSVAEDIAEEVALENYVFVKPYNDQCIGTFVCERLGINEKFYYGDDNYCLHLGVGMSLYTELPGFGKPTLISGHNQTVFAPLEYVQVGDVFNINLDWGKYTYQVYSVKVMRPDEFDVLFLAQHSTDIVVYTCYPFLGQTGSTERMFLYCHMLEGRNMLEVN